MNYLEKIASLILAKLEQERLLEELTAGNAQLSEVFESVQDGLLLCGLGKGIMQINTRGKNLLRMDDASPQAERLREEVMEVAREALDRHQILERQVDCRADQWERSLVIEARPVRGNAGSLICIMLPLSGASEYDYAECQRRSPLPSRNPQCADEPAQRKGQTGGAAFLQRFDHRGERNRQGAFCTCNSPCKPAAQFSLCYGKLCCNPRNSAGKRAVRL